MASTGLSRTCTQGNNKTATLSVWLKRGSGFGVEQYILGFGLIAGAYTQIAFDSSNTILVYNFSGGGVLDIRSYAKRRDPSAWLHFCVAFDSSQNTESNRIKYYINGTQVTGSELDVNYPALNADCVFNNNGQPCTVGMHNSSGGYYDGSMAMMDWVDGLQLDPTYFGSFDSNTGIWTPTATSTISNYGTNGFKLAMDTTTPGADTSGKGNTFTVSGTPTLLQGNPQNNWCTFNSIYKSQETLAYGNTASSLPSSNKFGGVASMGVNTGKWYAEFKMNSGSSSDSTAVGIYGNPIKASNNDQGVGKENNSLSYNSNGQKGLENSFSSYGASYTTGNVIGVALDMTSATKNITFYKDGASQGNITFNLEQGDEYEGFMFMAANSNTASTGSDWWANFGEGFFGTTAAGTNADGNGQGLFAYAVPSGYYALNTKNLEAYG